MRPIVFAALLVCPLLCGCAIESNRRVSSGDWSPEFLAETPAPRPAETTPSLNGLSRENWTLLTLSCSADPIAHTPTLRSNPSYTRTPRSTGAFPTADTALDDLGPSGERRQRYEALAFPLWAVWDVLNVPVRLWAHPFIDAADDQGPARRRQLRAAEPEATK